MTKNTVPIIDLKALPESNNYLALPAVSVVAVGGFISMACPVIRLGTKKEWVAALLVDHGPRDSFRRDYDKSRPGPDPHSYRMSDSPWARPQLPSGRVLDGRQANYNVSGRVVNYWSSAEAQWIIASFFVIAGKSIPVETSSHTTSMLIRCAELAIELCGGEAFQKEIP